MIVQRINHDGTVMPEYRPKDAGTALAMIEFAIATAIEPFMLIIRPGEELGMTVLKPTVQRSWDDSNWPHTLKCEQPLAWLTFQETDGNNLAIYNVDGEQVDVTRRRDGSFVTDQDISERAA